MATNYASEYCKALSQQYPAVLHFGALFARKQEGDYRWANAHTIEVPSVSVTGRVDGSRSSFLDRTQRHSNTWTALTLRNQRVWNDFIHPRDIDETNEVLSIANITRVMNDEQKFPEKDRYLISTTFADWEATGRVPVRYPARQHHSEGRYRKEGADVPGAPALRFVVSFILQKYCPVVACLSIN